MACKFLIPRPPSFFGEQMSFQARRQRDFELFSSLTHVHQKFRMIAVSLEKNFCPKKFGGLGITNSKFMNIALLVKWIWKLPQNAGGLWAELLKAKYLPNGSFFKSSACGSPFWNGLQAVKPAFAMRANSPLEMAILSGLARLLGEWTTDVVGVSGVLCASSGHRPTVADALSVSPPAMHFQRQLSPLENDRGNALSNRL